MSWRKELFVQSYDKQGSVSKNSCLREKNEKEESLSVPALSCTRLFQGLDLVDAG
jgi:hypothetical protein